MFSTPRIQRSSGADALARVHNTDALLAALYAGRGLRDPAEATPALQGLLPVAALHGIEQAADLLADHVRQAHHLLIVSDYDADGATGGALAVRGLRALGAARVSYLIPSRFAFGYGLSPEVVEVAALQDPDLLITVDNGIASVSGVLRARELGIPVLITDHHLPGTQLPDAAAIVNPNQPDCRFPSKHLAGVGVIFYVLAALRARLREGGWFGPQRPEPNLADLLDLVALGTVADVVALDHNNRILVEQGLRRIRAGRCCAGIRALLNIAGRDPARATTADLAFGVAPRLNAAGRIAEMSLGVECLLCDDAQNAASMAHELDTLNHERREIEAGMKDQAEDLVETLRFEAGSLPAGLCLFGEDWHQGVSGIVAARIRERYHRPVIAFAHAGEGLLRGSARSIEGVHIRDVLAHIDHRTPGLIERFGGHAMAAGVSIRYERLDRFRAAFLVAMEALLGAQPTQPEIRSDGALPPHLLNLDTAETLRIAAPWGKDFPEPLFDDAFRVLSARIVGERHLKLRVAPPGPDKTPIEAIGFNRAGQLPEAQTVVRLAYRLDVNDYRGSRSPQLIIEHLEPVMGLEPRACAS